jgi:Conserved TM helix
MWTQVNEVLNQAMARIAGTAANFLPGLLALFLILTTAAIIAFVVRAILQRLLERIHFDSRMDRWGFSVLRELSPSSTPAHLIARIAFLTILVLGLLTALSALDTRLSSLLIEQLFAYLPNAVAAVVVLFVGVIASRFLARSVLISAVNMQIQSARLLSLGVKWLVIVLSLAMALDHLRIGGTVVQMAFAILFGGIVLALALAVGLGSKEMVSRTWERQSDKVEKEPEEQFHHL